jgi:hypothetical protein
MSPAWRSPGRAHPASPSAGRRVDHDRHQCVITEALPGDLHSTTIAPADPFDEAEIDRAIAEIRMAIEKSSRLLK